MKTLKELNKELEATKAVSAWSKGVKQYALELLENLAENEQCGWDFEFFGSPADKKSLLNGAEDWNQYSWGGCSFIYNYEIAERLCSPSELKRTKGGDNRPNSREEWLDVQARALIQAALLIVRTARAE